MTIDKIALINAKKGQIARLTRNILVDEANIRCNRDIIVKLEKELSELQKPTTREKVDALNQAIYGHLPNGSALYPALKSVLDEFEQRRDDEENIAKLGLQKECVVHEFTVKYNGGDDFVITMPFSSESFDLCINVDKGDVDDWDKIRLDGDDLLFFKGRSEYLVHDMPVKDLYRMAVDRINREPGYQVSDNVSIHLEDADSLSTYDQITSRLSLMKHGWTTPEVPNTDLSDIPSNQIKESSIIRKEFNHRYMWEKPVKIGNITLEFADRPED